uniref:Uncharacterized protein n=1 Tax=Paramormyrops kingsleyae TaxID=1676925 RepID=A0A3B3RLB3_9TELE
EDCGGLPGSPAPRPGCTAPRRATCLSCWKAEPRVHRMMTANVCLKLPIKDTAFLSAETHGSLQGTFNGRFKRTHLTETTKGHPIFSGVIPYRKASIQSSGRTGILSWEGLAWSPVLLGI